ncbi:hypothetical protein ACFQDF_23935 [Ectobacillus funiculus]|uniref:Uncharacterized protein n=1 Tax=Ectobacillus funiculus TaxID=137993 RepID=A0ABV5WPD4_9BACI
MVSEVITFVADQWYHVGWFLDFGETGNTIFVIVFLAVCRTFIIKMWKMILTNEQD